MGQIKHMLRGKFITVNAYTRKEKSFQINNLSFQLKKLEKRANQKKSKSQKQSQKKVRKYKDPNQSQRKQKNNNNQ